MLEVYNHSSTALSETILLAFSVTNKGNTKCDYVPLDLVIQHNLKINSLLLALVMCKLRLISFF